MSNTISIVFILAFSLSSSYFALIFMLVKVAQCSLHLFEVPLDA